MKILLFEDATVENLYPLTLLRPVWELRCGAGTLLDKIRRSFPDSAIHFWMRPELAPVWQRKYGQPVNDVRPLLGKENLLLINGRWLLDSTDFTPGKAAEAAFCEKILLYAHLPAGRVQMEDNLSSLLKKVAGLPSQKKAARLITYPWDLVRYNPKALQDDFEALSQRGIRGKVANEAVVVGPENRLYVAPGAEVGPLTVLDTTDGPIMIAEGARILPFSRIEGPAYIGTNSLILSAARIRSGCTFGPECRIGGEVEATIIQGYTNKYHDGFLGHAYLGEWVNLGALTTNSDLKNNYTPVVVFLKGKPVESGELKVGSFLGDHTKTGIGTLLNTGSVVGVMANIASAGNFPPKYIPSFAWFIKGRFFKEPACQEQIKTAAAALARRGQTLQPEEETLLTHLYRASATERRRFKKGK